MRKSETPERSASAIVRPRTESTRAYLTASPPAIAPAAETRPEVAAQLSTQRTNQSVDFYRTVARLAVQAAEGLDYAHGLGVVHRDVKPANLLVDSRGNVWITDFGLAHFQADAGLTQSGDLLGTLRYMSPEQAGGQRVLIDHRTDVYSLGATMYELLTLRPMFAGADRQTLLHQILHEEPRPPRSINRAIPEELETIVLKAVAAAPADRYATARDFADDLQRFLRDEPILARRPTLAQRGRKWLRRHPAVPVAAAVLLVLLTAASLIAAWLILGEKEKTRIAYERERQAALLIKGEQEKTQRAFESEQRRTEQAEQRFQLARRTADRLFQLAQEELDDNPQLQGLRKRLLETVLEDYQDFIEQRRDDPDAQAALTEARDEVKRILDDLAVLQGAGRIVLLKDPAVLDDLKLLREQREQVEAAARQIDGNRDKTFDKFGRQTAEERRQHFVDMARTEEAAIARILEPAQIRRLRQILLQSKGPAAFRDSEVAIALKLTPEQRDRIRAIDWSPPPGRSDGFRFGPPGGRPSREMQEQARKAALEQMLAQLTEEQTKQWKEMTGKPFKGSLLPHPPDPRRGPRDGRP
jgi:hypothetical protein